MNILCHDFQYSSTLLETLKLLGYKKDIFLVSIQEPRINIEYGCKWTLLNPELNSVNNGHNFIFGVNLPSQKQMLFEKYIIPLQITEDRFSNIIHPSAVVMESVKLHKGIVIDTLSVISSYTEIGFGATINRNSSIGHHCSIGKFSSIHAGVNIASNVKIGDTTEIATGTTILPGRKIGNNTIIGAGSVVTRDIPDGVVAYGNPCRIVKANLKKIW
jgi:sugar O-acyltransferase (sialic acid O-acetyltransferase NeuD family)